MITKKEKIRKNLKSVWHRVAIRAKSPMPVFIFGEMRSGTNMLTDCFDRSWNMAIFNESDSAAFRGYELHDNEEIKNLIQESSATHVVFKSLADSYRASELLDLFPNAHAIWIFRNYADVVNSAIRKWTQHREYLSMVLSDKSKSDWRSRSVPRRLLSMVQAHYDRGIDDVSARALIWYLRNANYFDQELYRDPRVFLVRYEALARTPTREFERVYEFLDSTLKDSYFEKVSTRSIGREDVPDIDAEVRELCEELYGNLVAAMSGASETDIELRLGASEVEDAGARIG